MIPSIMTVSFYEVCVEAMDDLISSGSINERDTLPEVSLDEFARQLVVTSKSVVQEDDETSEEYAERLVYFAAKDAIEAAANTEGAA